ncbi:H-NS family nucleoid-associated regulatory protein [Paraburkholderia sp. JHI2823]|uniref:H-NS family nucleoid-associated regulatory protein n=1 Tax=Paraburkholderia sp. JHI2823 TaxID=3112960 RepID=UPI0031761432
MPPKYADPKTGATWSGRGLAQLWIRDVKDRSKFLVEAGATAEDAGAKAAPAKKAAAKRAVAKKVAKTAAKTTVATKKAGRANCPRTENLLARSFRDPQIDIRQVTHRPPPRSRSGPR